MTQLFVKSLLARISIILDGTDDQNKPSSPDKILIANIRPILKTKVRPTVAVRDICDRLP